VLTVAEADADAAEDVAVVSSSASGIGSGIVASDQVLASARRDLKLCAISVGVNVFVYGGKSRFKILALLTPQKIITFFKRRVVILTAKKNTSFPLKMGQNRHKQ
jgi:hypothetical protein